MTLNAREAHLQTTTNNSTNIAKVIGEIDSKIDQAIYNGDFSVTTKILSHKMQNEIRKYYEDLEYEVINFNNGMLGINW